MRNAEGVEQQRTHNNEDGYANAPAAQLSQHKNANGCDDGVDGSHLRGAREHLYEVVEHCAVVEEATRADEHDDDIIPRNAVGLHMVLACGVIQKTHDDNAAEKRGEALFQRRGGKQGGIDAIHRECSHNALHDPLRNAGPYSRVGLAVVLFHDLVDFFLADRLQLVGVKLRGGIDFHLG